MAQTMDMMGDVDDAFNFDGGGSSTMWVAGAVKNSPSDGSQRAVVDAVAIVSAPLPTSDIIVDNAAATVTGAWTSGTASG